METKVKILLSVGNLILNLFWRAKKIESESTADAEQFTLTSCCKFYERLFNIAVASNKPNNCLNLIATALHFYKMELNECCKTNYPDVYEYLQILTSRDSDNEDD
ncbi:hypothetical protein B566_EDAN010986 [Ephemera danica]|nr:hypothetical protein B566_EDAN010986 [Ephemera danica]